MLRHSRVTEPRVTQPPMSTSFKVSLRQLAALNLAKENHSKFPYRVVAKVGRDLKRLIKEALRQEEAYLNATSGGQMTVGEAVLRNQRVTRELDWPKADDLPSAGSKRGRDPADEFEYLRKTTLPSQAFADEVEQMVAEVMNPCGFEAPILGEPTLAGEITAMVA